MTSTSRLGDADESIRFLKVELTRLSREYLIRHRVCPRGILADGSVALVAAPDALLQACVDELRDFFAAPLTIERAAWPDVDAMIERWHADQRRHAAESYDDLVANRIDGEESSTADVRNLANQPPVVRYVSLLLRDALDANASDIHLEATRDGLLARIRVDGMLVPAVSPPRELGAAVVSRVKLIAELDIAERRRPQDGRIRIRLEDRELDIRLSTVPTSHGESVVLRLLDGSLRPVTLDALGMPARVLGRVDDVARRPHGMLLVTGPTGSGKTTTLYACLQRRELTTEKVVTIEDPVEYQLPGVMQVPVHRQAGVTFASALRSILRQDPDVVMIGEMRDAETAQIGVQAAMTGHLVLSTLHTNDALGAVARLMDLEVPSYLVASTLEAVVAQRLVRKVCTTCQVPEIPSAELLAELEANAGDASPVRTAATFMRGVGCPSCRGTGFSGRLGLYELLVVTDELREAITRNASRGKMREIAARSGFISLRGDGYAKARAGLTTIGEVHRVTQN